MPSTAQYPLYLGKTQEKCLAEVCCLASAEMSDSEAYADRIMIHRYLGMISEHFEFPMP